VVTALSHQWHTERDLGAAGRLRGDSERAAELGRSFVHRMQPETLDQMLLAAADAAAIILDHRGNFFRSRGHAHGDPGTARMPYGIGHCFPRDKECVVQVRVLCDLSYFPDAEFRNVA
jgi:hypothetical protein